MGYRDGNDGMPYAPSGSGVIWAANVNDTKTGTGVGILYFHNTVMRLHSAGKSNGYTVRPFYQGTE